MSDLQGHIKKGLILFNDSQLTELGIQDIAGNHIYYGFIELKDSDGDIHHLKNVYVPEEMHNMFKSNESIDLYAIYEHGQEFTIVAIKTSKQKRVNINHEVFIKNIAVRILFMLTGILAPIVIFDFLNAIRKDIRLKKILYKYGFTEENCVTFE